MDGLFPSTKLLAERTLSLIPQSEAGVLHHFHIGNQGLGVSAFARKHLFDTLTHWQPFLRVLSIRRQKANILRSTCHPALKVAK